MVRRYWYDQQQDIPKSNTSYFKAWNNRCFNMQGVVWKRNKEKTSEVLLLWNNSSKGDSLILLARDKAVFSELINPPFPWKLSHCEISIADYQAFLQSQEWGQQGWGAPRPVPALPCKESPAGRERRGKLNKFKRINKLTGQIEMVGGEHMLQTTADVAPVPCLPLLSP